MLIIGLEPASAKYSISEGYIRVPGTNDDICGGIIEEMMNSGLVDKVVKVSNIDAITTSDRLVREDTNVKFAFTANILLRSDTPGLDRRGFDPTGFQ